MIERIHQTIEEVRRVLAPDPRTAIFEVEAVASASGCTVRGFVSEPAALEELNRRFAGISPELEIQNRVVRLPQEVDGTPHALVTAAIAPMLAGPAVTEPQLSQVALGNRVLVLRGHGRWLQCRSTDGYLGWIHRGYLARREETEVAGWALGVDAPLHVSLGATVFGPDGGILARLPWGSRFGLSGNRAVLPDGREGELEGEHVPLAKLRDRFPSDGDAIVSTARSWTGTPYLWGGVTPWGADCSGFAQAILRIHGIEIPRDSDQQAEVGQAVDPGPRFSSVRAGDLLFFAERDRVSHVAISMGGPRIIHSALANGGVAENDLTGEGDYEAGMRRLLVGVRRVIGSGS